ncbi:MAG: hypothetical protein WA136_11735 [Rhodoferax sp.]
MNTKSVPIGSAVLALLLCLPLAAQELRDPTLAPPEAGVAAGGTAPASPLGGEGMTVVVRNGKPFLAVGTRLYAPGQKVGPLRIERITETEVWLREGGVLRKVPRFAGIQRSVAKAAPQCGKRTPQKVKKLSTAKTGQSSSSTPPIAPVVAPCESAQP